jgi:hypothetical protein
MSKTVQQKLHEQHSHWRTDLAAWRFDNAEWRKQLREALVALDDLQDVVRAAIDALETHADDVWEEEQRIRAHELALYEEALDGKRKQTDKQRAAAHRRQASRHERLTSAHERIKKYQHRVIAELSRLMAQARGAV